MQRSLFKIDKNMVFFHGLAWLSYTVLLFLINRLTVESVSFISLLVLSILFALIFYTTLWIFIVFYGKGRYLMTFTLILAFSLIIYVLGHWYIYSLMPELNIIIYLKEGAIYQKEYLQNTVLAITRFSIYSFIYYTVGVGKVRSQMLLGLTKEAHHKDMELVMAKNKALQFENELLTAQVDPHYIHNKINVLYGRLLQNAPEEADSVLQLNDILQYMMTPSIKGTGWVLIEKELENLQHAMKLDLSNEERGNVILSIHDEMELHLIPYMTLLTLFDNIIKYGVVNDPAHPVRMDLYMKADSLHFIANNKIEKNLGLNSSSHGTGLKSLKRRLDISFPGNNQFYTEVKGDYFIVDLLISY